MASGRKMRVMRLHAPGEPLRREEIPVPEPAAGQVLVRVRTCGVCRTDLHVADGDLDEPKLPLVLGHEIVGTVERIGPTVAGLEEGDRIGVPWLGSTCRRCRWCTSARENLCDEPTFTGYTRDGGFAELAVADARYCFRIPEAYSDEHAAPLLCAGLIGYRSYRMVGRTPQRLGLYGFGAAAHILVQIARHDGARVYAFTREGDTVGQEFARRLGAEWAGDSTTIPPEPLDAAILFAPVGALVPAALRATEKGSIVVCSGIHMSEIPSFPYRLLWEERVVRSVANLTRADGEAFFRAVTAVPVETTVEVFRLEEADEALARVRDGRLEGAAVLRIDGTREDTTGDGRNG